MARKNVLKKYKPSTSTMRHTVLVKDRAYVTGKPTQKSLIKPKRKVTGRRTGGKVTVRHRGGGVKRNYRMVDFKRDKRDIAGIVTAVEYDPNRTCYIALITYKDGVKRYIILPDGLKAGDSVLSSESASPDVGNALPLSKIPVGTLVHAVELIPGKGAQLGRSAGASIQLQGLEGKYAQLKMPSGEVRLVRAECYATIGSVSNPSHALEKQGKAGRKRYKGIRPTVRGMAMYGKAHPHGGGEARGVVGGPAKDPWGHRRGTKTRKRKNKSDKYILVRRTGLKVKH